MDMNIFYIYFVLIFENYDIMYLMNMYIVFPQCNIMIICNILYIKYHKHNITLGYVFVYKLCDFYLKNHTIYHKKQYRHILYIMLYYYLFLIF